MYKFIFVIWSFVSTMLNTLFPPPAIRAARRIFGSFRVIGLGLGKSAVQETRAVPGLSLGRFRTADAVSNNNVPSAQAYTFQAPAGVPGDITRVDESNTEPAMLIAVAAVFAQSFGIAMVYASGGISQWQAGSAAADFAGVLVRQAPGISESDAGLTGNVPNAVQVQALCVRGYINVLCVYGSPTRGGVVYVRSVLNGNNNVALGTFDATSDSSNNVALSLTQASWASDGKDANNNAELRIAR